MNRSLSGNPRLGRGGVDVVLGIERRGKNRAGGRLGLLEEKANASTHRALADVGWTGQPVVGSRKAMEGGLHREPSAGLGLPCHPIIARMPEKLHAARPPARTVPTPHRLRRIRPGSSPYRRTLTT